MQRRWDGRLVDRLRSCVQLARPTQTVIRRQFVPLTEVAGVEEQFTFEKCAESLRQL